MFCGYCGEELLPNAKFCNSCGRKVTVPGSAPEPEKEPAEVARPKEEEPVREEPAWRPVYAQTAQKRTAYEAAQDEPIFREQPEPELPAENRPMSPWAYFGFGLLFSIPVVGFILLIVFSFAGGNVNRKNFARSYWCWLIVILAIVLILMILVLTGVLSGPFESIFDQIKNSFSGLFGTV